MLNKSKFAGFSIIELSVVLIVIALIATTALAVGASKIESARIKSTQERIGFIMHALEVFVQRYGYLPCPSDNRLAPSNTLFGDGQGTGRGNLGPPLFSAGNYCWDYVGSTESVNKRLPFPRNVAGPNIVAGGVPTKQLAISPSIATDGWGQRFEYIVDEDLTFKDPATPAGWSDDANEGQIKIRNSAAGADLITDAAVVIISFGPDGFGARYGKGGNGRISDGTCSTKSADTNQNASFGAINEATPSSDTTCTPFDDIFVQKLLTKDFNDFVEYRTKWQFEID